MIKKKNDKKIEVQQQSQYESLYNILTYRLGHYSVTTVGTLFISSVTEQHNWIPV